MSEKQASRSKTTEVAMLREALRNLVDCIDGGVTPEIFVATEKERPQFSSLRYAREVLRYGDHNGR